MSRRIIGPLIDPTTGDLLVSTAMRVETATVFAGSAATFPREVRDLTTDMAGQFDLTLSTPASGTQPYIFRIQGSPPITLNIGSGPDTTLHALIGAAASAVSPSAMQAHADLIASESTLGHVRVDGVTILIDDAGVLSIGRIDGGAP